VANTATLAQIQQMMQLQQMTSLARRQSMVQQQRARTLARLRAQRRQQQQSAGNVLANQSFSPPSPVLSRASEQRRRALEYRAQKDRNEPSQTVASTFLAASSGT
jgi:hypothetical protein